jgi:hypothetical protein
MKFDAKNVMFLVLIAAAGVILGSIVQAKFGDTLGLNEFEAED